MRRLAALLAGVGVVGAAVGLVRALFRRRRRPTIVSAAMTASAVGVASMEATARRGFTSPHLQAAEHFAQELAVHEQGRTHADFSTHYDLALWLASAAIILSFSAIEAAVDEAADDLDIPQELATCIERAPTLDKCQAILAHVGAQVFDRGRAPFQSVSLLRDIRNGLVHPRAEWDHERDVHARLTRRILAAQLPLRV